MNSLVYRYIESGITFRNIQIYFIVISSFRFRSDFLRERLSITEINFYSQRLTSFYISSTCFIFYKWNAQRISTFYITCITSKSRFKSFRTIYRNHCLSQLTSNVYILCLIGFDYYIFLSCIIRLSIKALSFHILVG